MQINYAQNNEIYIKNKKTLDTILNGRLLDTSTYIEEDKVLFAEKLIKRDIRAIKSVNHFIDGQFFEKSTKMQKSKFKTSLEIGKDTNWRDMNIYGGYFRFQVSIFKDSLLIVDLIPLYTYTEIDHFGNYNYFYPYKYLLPYLKEEIFFERQYLLSYKILL